MIRMGWIDNGDTWLDLSTLYDADDASAFLQQWLFFGLLHEFFGDDIVFSVFIETDENSNIQYIHTGELLPLARAFMEKEPSDKSLPRKNFRLKNCLQKTYSIYHAVTDEQDEFLDPYLQLSLVATARFLTHVASLLYPGNFKQDPWTLPCVMLDEDRLANAKDVNGDMDILGVGMVKAGWCPRQVAIAERCSFETYYFCSQLRLPSGRGPEEEELIHHRCTQLQCLALQVDERTYQTKHVQPECDCAWLSLETDALATILQGGRIPIVAFDTDSEQLTLSSAEVSSNTPTPYIALSHVWSDGLGNPHANALPLCQLRRIAAFIQGLLPAPQPPTAAQSKPWFWMDTLCCPVKDRTARSLAIQRMRQTYQRASRVLILAADLQAVAAADLPIADCVYLTGLSFWASRLWTLQEGALAKSADVLFKDRIFTLDEAWGADLTSSDPCGLSRLDSVDFDYMLCLIRGDRSATTSNASSTQPATFSLRFASIALARRATSVKEDEALCLGSLLEADMRQITGAPRKQDRMRALWATLPCIPREVLFLRERTMEEVGFRWAPRTFLGIPNAGNNVVLGTEGTAWVTPEGLRTKAWGMEVVGLLWRQEGIPDVLRIRDGKTGQVYSVIRQAPLLRGEKEEVGIKQGFGVPEGGFGRVVLVLEDGEVGRAGMNCVMVFVWKEEGGVLYAWRGDPAFITTRDVNVDREDDEEAADNFEDACSGEMDFKVTATLSEKPQTWCID
ncbi:hypothetical protein V5O48_000412 [Marasmius crinis-equi]|uniref:Heterokaryon incompatibility domain-containing protein n=1 Tax=Marasmius crinis-equi TaxID=585013 RepID=A0ABR3G1B5_9AGAR